MVPTLQTMYHSVTNPQIFYDCKKYPLGYKQHLIAQKNEEGIPEKKADLPSSQNPQFATAISKQVFRIQSLESPFLKAKVRHENSI